MYVDVHAHLIHPKFQGEEDAVAQRAVDAGLEYVIVNGLEPKSNRAVLELCERHAHLLPACGIYPVDAIAQEIADQGWEQTHIGKGQLFTAEPWALMLEALFQLFQGLDHGDTRPVVSRLVPREEGPRVGVKHPAAPVHLGRFRSTASPGNRTRYSQLQ